MEEDETQAAPTLWSVEGLSTPSHRRRSHSAGSATVFCVPQIAQGNF